MADLVDRARSAVTERAELPGMSLIQHLEELRRRLIHSAIYLVVAFFIAYGFHEKIYGFMHRVGALSVKAASWKDLFFPEIADLPGS